MFSMGVFFFKKTVLDNKSVFDDKKFFWNASYENLPEKNHIEDLFLLEPELFKYIVIIRCNNLLGA